MKYKIYALLILLISSFPGSSNVNADEVQSPRFLVHLLDYLAKDYSGAVANGKVLSQSEYGEQVEFSKTALQAARTLPEIASHREVETNVNRLNQMILAKADPTKVAELARAVQNQVIQIAHVEMAPIQWPSLKRGQVLYSQTCVACHGAKGAGDGLAGKNLSPRPANFLDQHMEAISPFQAFNTIRLGVPGTGMAPNPSYSDREVWDLSFYVLSLRHHQVGELLHLEKNDLDQSKLTLVATSSDAKLKKDIKSKNKEAMIAALRSHSDDDDSGGNSLDLAKEQLDSASQDYKNGLKDSAKSKALKAYLEGIEPIEPRLKATNAAAVSILEEKMAVVRSSIENEKNPNEVAAAVFAAKAEIDSCQKLLISEKMSPWLAFLAAAAIILREGFEAVLVVIALLGVIRAAGSKKAAAWVHGGWISALGLGVVAWFLAGWLMAISGAQRETLEGATSLFAVVVLLVVGFWLHSQTEIGRWKSFIHGKVQRALDGKNLYTLASISFIAVFREAFETVLFLRAIWLEGGEDSKFALIAGVVGSIALVICLAWALLKYSAKIPIRKLFAASSVIMLFLAFVLTGKGLHSFQETGRVSISASQSLFHFDFLGLYPTWETLISQIVIFTLAITLWWYGKRPTTPEVIRG